MRKATRVRFWRKSKYIAQEREKIARLEEAETRSADLRQRADAAILTLENRRGRNHWREAIQQMIEGVS